jgi:hypothetical protein
MYSNKTIARYGEAKSTPGGTGIYFDGESFNEYLQSFLQGKTPAKSRASVEQLMKEYGVEDLPEEESEVDDDNEQDRRATEDLAEEDELEEDEGTESE